MPTSGYRGGTSLLLHGVQDTQDMQEEVDDVQVEVDGGQDVLLGGQLVHQEMGVVDDEATEQQSPGASKQQLCCVIVEEEPHETSNDQDPQSSEQSGSQLAEVPLGLEGVGSQSQEHSGGEDEGLEHYGIVIERHGCSDRDCLQQSKCEQQVEVDGMLMSVDKQGHQ